MTGPVRIFCLLTYPCLPDTLPVPLSVKFYSVGEFFQKQ